MPVRLGIPQGVAGLADVVRNPIYATGVGLLLFGHNNRGGGLREVNSPKNLQGVIERMKSWFQGNF